MPRRFANGSGSSSSSGSDKADESAGASVGRRKKAQHKAKAMIDRMKLKSLKKKRQPRPHPDLCAMPAHLHERVQELGVLSDDEGDGEAEEVCAETAEILSKNKNNPWFNEDIASIVRLCRKYRRKHHKSKTKKTELKQICKELEKKKRKLIRAAKQKWNGGRNGSANADESDVHTQTQTQIAESIDPPTPPLLPAQCAMPDIDATAMQIYTMMRDNHLPAVDGGDNGNHC